MIKKPAKAANKLPLNQLWDKEGLARKWQVHILPKRAKRNVQAKKLKAFNKLTDRALNVRLFLADELRANLEIINLSKGNYTSNLLLRYIRRLSASENLSEQGLKEANLSLSTLKQLKTIFNDPTSEFKTLEELRTGGVDITAAGGFAITDTNAKEVVANIDTAVRDLLNPPARQRKNIAAALQAVEANALVDFLDLYLDVPKQPMSEDLTSEIDTKICPPIIKEADWRAITRYLELQAKKEQVEVAKNSLLAEKKQVGPPDYLAPYKEAAKNLSKIKKPVDRVALLNEQPALAQLKGGSWIDEILVPEAEIVECLATDAASRKKIKAKVRATSKQQKQIFEKLNQEFQEQLEKDASLLDDLVPVWDEVATDQFEILSQIFQQANAPSPEELLNSKTALAALHFPDPRYIYYQDKLKKDSVHLNFLNQVSLDPVSEQSQAKDRKKHFDQPSALALYEVYMQDRQISSSALQHDFLKENPMSSLLKSSQKIALTMQAWHAATEAELAKRVTPNDDIECLATWTNPQPGIYELTWKEIRPNDLYNLATCLTYDVAKNLVTLKRLGEMELELQFKLDEHQNGHYVTPYGKIPLATHTRAWQIDLLNPQAGIVELNYSLINNDAETSYVKVKIAYNVAQTFNGES